MTSSSRTVIHGLAYMTRVPCVFQELAGTGNGTAGEPGASGLVTRRRLPGQAAGPHLAVISIGSPAARGDSRTPGLLLAASGCGSSRGDGGYTAGGNGPTVPTW